MNTPQKNRKLFWQPVIYSLLLTIGLLTGFFIAPVEKSRFYQILDIVKADYVDEPNPRELEEDAITGMLSQLDPHSSFVPADLVEYAQRQISGNYQGIGIEFILFQDTPVVISVTPHGPAFSSGIKRGDRIIEVDKTLTTQKELTRNDVISLISGQSGSTCVLKIYRPHNQRTLTTQVFRAQVPVRSIEVYYMIDRSTGYLQIRSFSARTHADFMIAVNKLKEAGMKNLVIDLRNNGGGLLRESIKLSNEFLKKNQMIAFTRGRKRRPETYRADGKGKLSNMPTLVLVNNRTASASEIFAGALQDNDRALISGSRTFGKGLVQEPYRLPDGSSLRLTVARYYTPSGRSIQKPYTRNIQEYRQEIFRRGQDTTQKNTLFYTLSGREVAAGGGISPDFQMTDTLSQTQKFEKHLPGLLHSRLIDMFLIDHMRDELFAINRNYPKYTSFAKHYKVSNATLNKLKQYLNKHYDVTTLTYDTEAMNLLRKFIKSELAKYCYSPSGFSYTRNWEDGLFPKIQLAFLAYSKILPQTK